MKLIFSLVFLLTFGSLKGQDVIDSVLYNHSISAPENLNEDIEELIEYLSQVAKTDKQKIQVISYWITNNIEYDLTGFFSNSYGNSSWANTLITKKAVCQGYSELFKEFCDLLDIECYLITGYAKGYGIEPGYSFQETNHAWNIVKINGVYELFDLTWASGHSSFYDSSLYVKKLDPKFLFANPISFVEQHLPGQNRWQLLNFPVSIDEFEKNVEAEHMIDSAGLFYNFSDSIAAYSELDEYDREICDLNKNYEVLPSELNRALLSYKSGYILSFGKYDEDRFNKSLELFTIALTTYQKPEYENPSYVENILQNMEYVKSRLENKK
ncbi:Transglutaminase-like superfamily protein [Reichenbachiella agariperforans]|uniref:Transglutaminase-like superfamily protein n=1 Tax=Reichenbachiella agariperforans TaxID=156994 RepID=A0A1M6T4X0_REIAG|nr:transglutaminase domain-containing protein [Reichenbachiella agariperforans]SHK52001.1 Transglutaminase-like superfamily protein [Reichenbachiella agariperforans]